MTYRAGMGPALARHLGYDGPAVPTLSCDVVGCGTSIEVKPTRGGAPAWLRNKRAPRGWRRFDKGDAPAQHMCPLCAKAIERG